jgi:hydrogenase/urease accessory protein HupE
MKIGVALKILFHCIGLSCLAGAVFLGLLVFYSVDITGAFYGIEVNRVTSSVEFFCMFFAATYLMHLTGHAIISCVKRV